jgi:hypothetical protein
MSTVRFAGFSRSSGVLKFRTANDAARAQQLAKLGDVEIDMIILPNEMTKNDAAKWVLVNIDRYTSTAEKLALLTATVKDENPFARTAKLPAKVKTPQVSALKGMTPLGIKPTTVVVKNAVIKPASNDSKDRAKFIAKLFKDIVDA